MKAANFVGVKSDNRKTDMTYTHNKSRNPNTIFPSPGQHKVGGPKCASATNKKSRILSVVCFVCQLLASYSVKKLYFCSCGKNARQKINKGVYGDSYFI